ncbi:MAG: hypothetical protein HY900_35905 [Deltaproteobacteria bacterium]|nr:hypothetical protein [Deltaproteobacteria bacterium]
MRGAVSPSLHDFDEQDESRTLFQSLTEAIRASAARAMEKSMALGGPSAGAEACGRGARALPSAAEIISLLEGEVDAIVQTSGLTG